MTYQLLLVAHIVVLGYWLGSELVINTEYRFIAFRSDLDFAARDAMTTHLMDVDQHVRYALILQLSLGTMLAVTIGAFPTIPLWLIAVLGGAWLALVEITHRKREVPLGAVLARIDRGVRYGMAAALVIAALGAFPDMPYWLRVKLAFFVGVITCGVVIRFQLIRHFQAWAQMREQGSAAEHEAIIRRTYVQATAVLLLLWFNIIAATLLAIFKPF